MSTSPELEVADEVLKGLVQRFREDPASQAGSDLAAALLARGHATEALRVAEKSLALNTRSLDARVLRASALLALSRAKVAYIELRRCLAVDTRHQRSLRLLGNVYMELGRHKKAAELLHARGEEITDTDTEIDEATDIFERPPEFDFAGPKTEVSDYTPLPQLFPTLTDDLGLEPKNIAGGWANQVEVTQIIRTRKHPRTPRNASELRALDQPIVDSSRAPTNVTRDPNDDFTDPQMGELWFDINVDDGEGRESEDISLSVSPLSIDLGESPEITQKLSNAVAVPTVRFETGQMDDTFAGPDDSGNSNAATRPHDAGRSNVLSSILIALFLGTLILLASLTIFRDQLAGILPEPARSLLQRTGSQLDVAVTPDEEE